MDIEFSLFSNPDKGIKETYPKKDIDLLYLERIYHSDKLKTITKNIKAALLAGNDIHAKQIKKQLPYITPYGTFSRRCTDNLRRHNSNLVALDFDGLSCKAEANYLKGILKQSDSVILCAISPRSKGVKALILVSEALEPQSRYEVLKHNRKLICEALKISDWEHALDNAQFVLTQPFFLAYDANLYFNHAAEPLLIKWQHHERKKAKNQTQNATFNFQNEGIKSKINDLPIEARTKLFIRISKYLQNAAEYLASDLATKQEGQRHVSIIKVQIIASWMHYLDAAINLKSFLLDCCCSMYDLNYDKEADPDNVVASFERAWNEATPKRNDTIERIISEVREEVLSCQI